MKWWQALLAQAHDSNSLVFLLLWTLVWVLWRRARGAARSRARSALLLGMVHLALLPLVAALRASEFTSYREARLVFSLIGGLAAASMVTFVTFHLVLPRLRLKVPRIVEDVTTVIIAAIFLLAVASNAGFNVTGAVATSAVLTAVIGLALQDTMGNLIGGLALQTDDSLAVGDWVEVSGRQGRVVEIRWRYTAIETRDWETMLIPNSMLVKGQVIVLGRRRGQPRQLRRHVPFNVDFRTPPQLVADVVTSALRAAPIPHVASEPAPEALFVSVQDSYARYEVRYYLTAIERDTLTDHRVMVRTHVALQRHGIPLAMPARALFLTAESHEREQAKLRRRLGSREEALSRIPLTADLEPEERAHLAATLSTQHFTPGERLAVEGEPGHCLFLLRRGEVAVSVATREGHQELARLHPGDFFGEMSLLTGAPRAATVEAVTEVDVFCLDKAAFESILLARPAAADLLAHQLSERGAGLQAAKRTSVADLAPHEPPPSAPDLLSKIQHFFKLQDRKHD